MAGNLNMLKNKIRNLPEPTAVQEASTKYYIDSKFPTVTTANNGIFSQVRSGRWYISTIIGIPITYLNNIAALKSGCIYTVTCSIIIIS